MSMMKQQLMIEQPLLSPIAPAGEEQRVEAILAMAREHLGFVPDGLRLYSISPALLESFFSNVGYFSGETTLPAVLTTMIRYLVSSQANCQFCIDMNEGFLVNMGIDLDRVREARNNPALAPVEERERVLLDIALRSVNAPQSITQTDMDAAHVQGWSDREIFDAVAQATNNRAFNNLLRTFNVEQQGVFSQV